MAETILLVDDELLTLKLCQQILSLDGYSCLLATSGEQALRLLEQDQRAIDLALLDVMMPGMNGIELAMRIESRNPDTLILLMTGYGPEEIARLAGENNRYRIIWKPFKAESLRRMIENVLNDSTGAAARNSSGN